MRNNQYCHSTSHPRIVKEFEAQYITAYQDRIIDEFEGMLKQEQFQDCTLAYTLLSRISDGLKPILEVYENYVTKLGKDILSRLGSSILKNPYAYVDELLSLHQKYYQVNQQVFGSDPLFTAAVDKAFRSIVNESWNTSLPAQGPEALARYCDMMLKKNTGKKDAIASNSASGKRKGLKKRMNDLVDEGDQEQRLMKMITLFKYVDDKDVFQKFYSRMLAKRLIYNASSSEELEVNMINRLKEICGVEYTSKLNKMFTDISLSSDLNSKYKTHMRDKGQVNMDILVLTAGAWPLNQKEEAGAEANKLQIPSILENCISSFESFYANQYNGRRLLWQWNLARGEVRINRLDKNYELQVSLYQMIILLLFNRHAADGVSMNDIIAESGLSFQDTMRSLKPLVDMQIFQTLDDGPLSQSSLIQFNSSFNSKRTKIKVTASSAATAQNETQQESQAARRSVDEDRRMYLQAAIVRIMKSRQVLPHVQLIQEIFDQANSRFSPSVVMIKKCIEQLLEKQFIARQERDTYVYVA
ncbi:Cullin-2 [Choanephora cucurbitarum]|uniref:Cullin-2 n=1 Tax=Choanephora cucurbitarum TaxID=101091 RepID=A0A1C7NC12_9FUNG|nr:Cullin-2 [Choanephora cucurbitarum]